MRSDKLVCGENIRLRSPGSVSRMARNEARPILAPFRLSELFPGRTPTVTMATILNVYPVHSHPPRAARPPFMGTTTSLIHRITLSPSAAYDVWDRSCLSLSLFERSSSPTIWPPISLSLLPAAPALEQNVPRIAIVYISLHPSCPTSKQPDVSDPEQQLQIVSVSGYGIAQYVVERVCPV